METIAVYQVTSGTRDKGPAVGKVVWRCEKLGAGVGLQRRLMWVVFQTLPFLSDTHTNFNENSWFVMCFLEKKTFEYLNVPGECYEEFVHGCSSGECTKNIRTFAKEQKKHQKLAIRHEMLPDVCCL